MPISYQLVSQCYQWLAINIYWTFICTWFHWYCSWPLSNIGVRVGLRVLTLLQNGKSPYYIVVGPPNLLYLRNHSSLVYAVSHLQIQPSVGSCSTSVFTTEKKPHVSRLMQFKPVLVKGQLYFQFCWLNLISLSKCFHKFDHLKILFSQQRLICFTCYVSGSVLKFK